MSKFEETRMRIITEAFDVKALMAKATSTFGAIVKSLLSIFPFLKKSHLLETDEKLAQMYTDLVEYITLGAEAGGKDPKAIEAEMKAYLKENPPVLDAIVTEVRKNILDRKFMSIGYLVNALRVSLELGLEDEHTEAVIETALKKYDETKDEKELIADVNKLIDAELETLKKAIA